MYNSTDYNCLFSNPVNSVLCTLLFRSIFPGVQLLASIEVCSRVLVVSLQNALDLTAPASDVLLKNRLKSWFQLTGHPDGFAPAGPGTVWKRKTGGAENTERIVYEVLSKDKELRDCIPR